MPNVRSSSPRPQFVFPPDLFTRLKGYADRKGLTNTAVVIAAVTEYLNRHDKEGR